MICVEHVSKKIKHQVILDDITLQIDTGKCYGFTGYNGCGKTMLLRAICGYMKLDSGKVMVDNYQIGKTYDYIQDAGVIIGEPDFINGYTGFDNLAILADINKKISYTKIEDIMKILGIYEAKDKKVRKYSLGMKQRLRLAQALMEEPSILILDEPFNALDKDGTQEIQKILLKKKEDGITVLLTSHDERNIELLCDTVFQLESGRIAGRMEK